MLKERIKNNITNAINQLILDKKLTDTASHQTPVVLDTKDKSHGDYASNIAMVLSKAERKPPREIAECIKGSLVANGYFDRIDVAGPGFLNFTLSPSALSEIIPLVAQKQRSYGSTPTDPNKRALIEFVSANPTGGLHLGHARGAFMGDALARLLSAAGFFVTKEFYVNDVGNQIETLARTIHKRYRELFGETVSILEGEYPGDYVIDIAQALKDQVGDLFLNKDESEWMEFISEFGVKANLKDIRDTLKSADIEMDNWYFESTLHKNGKRDELLNLYQQKGMLYEADEAHGTENKVRREDSKASRYAHLQAGGIFLKTAQFGDDEDRIIKRRDGRFVYLTADLAYHHEKFERGYDLIIDVFGGDHAGHIGRIKAGMMALGHNTDKLKFVVTQMVRLVRAGKEVRFSKRTGDVEALSDLIFGLGKDVARFVFLMRSANAQFDLDLDLITAQSNDNPVFYVQYGHARMATILRKAEDQGIIVTPCDFSVAQQEMLTLPEERELILRVGELSEVVEEAALALEPHRLIYFCHDLIKTFHSYFTKYRHSEKIISDDIQKTKARLSLVFAVKETIYNALSFLGISAPDYMDTADNKDLDQE